MGIVSFSINSIISVLITSVHTESVCVCVFVVNLCRKFMINAEHEKFLARVFAKDLQIDAVTIGKNTLLLISPISCVIPSLRTYSS